MSGKSKRGFASMNPERQREIASKGGRAAHAKGTAHQWSRDEARTAGRKGGVAVSRDRAHMSAIGREGGEARGRASARARGAGGGGGQERGGAGARHRFVERESLVGVSREAGGGGGGGGPIAGVGSSARATSVDRMEAEDESEREQ
ncbi:MAG: KGG domain-containing protein [Gemmatimonadota bacterium]